MTRLAARLAAALREEVGPPDQWEVRPLKMRAPDDPTVLWIIEVRFRRVIGGRVFQAMKCYSPHLLRDSVADIAFLAGLCASEWRTAAAAAEQDEAIDV